MEENVKVYEKKEKKKSPITLPFTVALVGVLVMVIALFLPYLTAVGETARRIEKNPNNVEIRSLDVKARDLENVPIISAGNIATAVYNEEEGEAVKGVVVVFCALVALTAMFVILKKPIVVMVFNLLACVVFLFLNTSMAQEIVGDDKYTWGLGYYAIWIAVVAVLVGAIWLLVKKKELKKVLQTDLTE